MLPNTVDPIPSLQILPIAGSFELRWMDDISSGRGKSTPDRLEAAAAAAAAVKSEEALFLKNNKHSYVASSRVALFEHLKPVFESDSVAQSSSCVYGTSGQTN